MHWRRSLFLLSFFFFIFACGNEKEKNVSPENNGDTTTAFFPQKACRDYACYSLFFKQKLKLELCDQRPSKKDTSIKLCIAAAFTQLENDSIDGLYIINGKVKNRNSVNHHLGGGLLINGDEVSVIATGDGSILTHQWIDSISAANCSFLQQIRLVSDGFELPLKKNKDVFQRRAIGVMQDGNVVMIESKEAITLDDFGHDLMTMQIKDAIYTDMGDWDEGWYRDEKTGQIVTIGTSLASTDRQSNWLIFRR
ncbi:MAG TPA: phosphodiester glycosidase family protein [Bacteroidia bacterium]|jgi:hypothetical protein|nr:phosphodiester glycosidase family protein [Bacteroidia bacterium]